MKLFHKLSAADRFCIDTGQRQQQQNCMRTPDAEDEDTIDFNNHSDRSN